MATIVGTRAEFISAAVVSREIRRSGQGKIREVTVNAGQHYDYELSRIFFDQLGVSPPDFDLSIGSRDRAKQMSEILEKMPGLLRKLKPRLVLIHGDTNSALAGAICAHRQRIPVAHVNAGLRCGDMKIAEEQNRVLVDHLAAAHYCPTPHAVENLKREGISRGVTLIGDLSFDAHLVFANAIESRFRQKPPRLPRLPGRFFLAAIHQAENTGDTGRLREILDGLKEIGLPCVFPVQPGTRAAIAAHRLAADSGLIMTDPTGFLEMLYLESKCEFVITDSGGVQKEAYFFYKPCVTVRDSTEWIETVESHWNRLVPVNAQRIRSAAYGAIRPQIHPEFYGNGSAALKLVSELMSLTTRAGPALPVPTLRLI